MRRQRLLVLTLVLGSLPACGRTSREVMSEVDRHRTDLAAALEARDLAAAREASARVLGALEARVVREQWREPGYDRHWKRTRELAGELSRAPDEPAARRLFGELERSCQSCHDDYQYRKKQ